jgi:hypothetical protein
MLRARMPMTRRTLLRLSMPLSAGGLAALLYLSKQAETPRQVPNVAVRASAQPAEAAGVTTPNTPPTPLQSVALTRPSPSVPTQVISNWQLRTNRGTIKGFADKISAAESAQITIFVTTRAPSFNVYAFRLGWYDGGASQAQLVRAVSGLPGRQQPPPVQDVETGLISAANWTSSGTLDLSGWRTGLYLLKLIAADGDENYIPLVVRDDVGQHEFLFEHAVTTDQAYNAWGGKSMYAFNSSGEVTIGGSKAAVKVSFDRPFDGNGSGGSMLQWELNMVRWMEAQGFDVAYVSDVDVHRDPQFAARTRAVLQAGHSEYWSKEMRDHLEAVRDRGKGLGFFTGDTGSWAVRFEDSPVGPNRVQVCYRDVQDPVALSDPSRATNHWRDPPVNRPTQEFFGIGTNGPVRRSADWVAEGVESAPELFTNTGFKNGDVVPNLVGYEYDGLWTLGAGMEPPMGLRVLGRARVIPNDKPDALLNFNVVYEWPAAEGPSVGRFATMVETLDFSPEWTIAIHLVSASRSAYLVYSAGGDKDAPARFPSGGDEQVFFSLGEVFYTPGWRRIDRDLSDDYRTIIGSMPSDLRLQSILLRGSLSLSSVTLTASDGQATDISFRSDASPEANGWRVAQGAGDLAVNPSGPSGEAALAMRTAIPDDRRGDEAHTVAVQTPGKGLIVAVGSINWSWALDDYDYNHHTDTKGDRTNLDRRIQALTRNILVALRGTEQESSGA